MYASPHRMITVPNGVSFENPLILCFYLLIKFGVQDSAFSGECHGSFPILCEEYMLTLPSLLKQDHRHHWNR